MGNKRICVLLLCLAFAGISAAVQTEPNDAPLKLKFQTSTRPQGWTVRGEKDEEGETLFYADPGPTKPTHVAEVVLSRTDWLFRFESDILERIERSPIANKLSRQQTDFLGTGFAIRTDYENHRIPKHYSIWLYAMSEDDAKKTAEGFIEVLGQEATARRHERAKRREEFEQKIADIKKDLPEREAQAKAAGAKYKGVKNTRYPSFADAEAVEKAKETMLQMGKMLDVVDIELAGIREKLEAIEQYRRSKHVPGKDLSDETLEKLDQMLVEQMIELRSAEARRQAIFRVLGREKACCSCFEEWTTLDREVRRLKDSLTISEVTVRNLEKELANPGPHMLPPKVFQNKVTIYPVSVD
jgi:hypothetical protein